MSWFRARMSYMNPLLANGQPNAQALQTETLAAAPLDHRFEPLEIKCSEAHERVIRIDLVLSRSSLSRTQNNPKQPKTTQNNPKQPKTTQNNPKQPKTTQNNPKQPQTTPNSPTTPHPGAPWFHRRQYKTCEDKSRAMVGEPMRC